MTHPFFITEQQADRAATSKTRVASLLDWIFGASPNESTHLEKTSPTASPDLDIAVQAPQTSSWVESFLNALTEATTLFAHRHVALIHQEDPTQVFTIREVKIECKDAPAQFVRDITSLAPDVRNRVIKSRMSRAPGATPLLSLEEFFGSTIVSDITMVDGQLVHTMVSYAGCRFMLKFAFDGDYTTRPNEPKPQNSAAPNPAIHANSNVNEPDATPLSSHFRNDPTLDVAEGTTLNTGRTDMFAAPRPVANLRLRSVSGEITIPLMPDNFPYTIGRHSTLKSYAVSGQNDREPQEVLIDNATSFVSRKHLVLDRFDPVASQFQIITSNGKNGTYFKATQQPTHLLLPLSAMAQGEWLKLGGTSGDTILELRLEAV